MQISRSREMQINYSKYALDPRVVENLIRRFNKAIELESMHRPDYTINFNDIASAMGASMLEFAAQIPNDWDRVEALSRYIDVLKLQAKNAAAEQPLAPGSNVNN